MANSTTDLHSRWKENHMAQVDALTAYLMSNDPEVVAAARAQLDAREGG